jgi:hypothetical protein
MFGACLRSGLVAMHRVLLIDGIGEEELDKDEARILDLLARGLLREFPNPQRVGCPGTVVLRGIAFRKLRLAEVHEWLDHLSSCSPCYREFTEQRKKAVRTNKQSIS